MEKGLSVSTDMTKMDLDFIHGYLSGESYWAKGRSRELVLRSMQNSLCFGLFDGDKQIGFGRVATDYVAFAWLMDLFIHPDYRGQGLGQKLLQTILEHRQLKELNGMGLRTKDAHELYMKFGFGPVPEPETWLFKKM